MRPRENWLEHISEPMRKGIADAVGGPILMPDHLKRSWMSLVHSDWLACRSADVKYEDVDLVGANMAFSRDVLKKVPYFDSELGSGALGYADDTLFSRQLRISGFRIVTQKGAYVDHYFNIDRLTYQSWIGVANKASRSFAYLQHHWNHQVFSLRDCYRAIRSQWKLSCPKAVSREYSTIGGIPEWELWERMTLLNVRYLLRLLRTPRQYDRHGLVKRVCG